MRWRKCQAYVEAGENVQWLKVQEKCWGRKNLKSVWWNDKEKAAIRRKVVLVGNNEEAKEMHMECKEKKKEVKRCIYQNKTKVNEQFERM